MPMCFCCASHRLICGSGEIKSKPCPENPKLRMPLDLEKRILSVRRAFGLGELRIKWYLQRYYSVTVLPSGRYHVSTRHGVNRLPKGAPKRSASTLKRCEKLLVIMFTVWAEQPGKPNQNALSSASTAPTAMKCSICIYSRSWRIFVKSLPDG